MDDNQTYDMDRDFVYTPTGPDGKPMDDVVDSVRLRMKVGEQRITLYIISKNEVSGVDKEHIMQSVSGLLKKMKIDMAEDCDIYFIEPNVKYQAKFTEGICTLFPSQS